MHATLPQVNPLLLAGWAGLAINCLNLIPVGELDGGRIALALLGRRVSSILGVLTTTALGLSAFNNRMALYWLLVVLLLQVGGLLTACYCCCCCCIHLCMHGIPLLLYCLATQGLSRPA